MTRYIQSLPFLFLLVMISTTLSSCEVVEGIFKVGFWAGIIIVVLVVLLILWIIKKIR